MHLHLHLYTYKLANKISVLLGICVAIIYLYTVTPAHSQALFQPAALIGLPILFIYLAYCYKKLFDYLNTARGRYYLFNNIVFRENMISQILMYCIMYVIWSTIYAITVALYLLTYLQPTMPIWYWLITSILLGDTACHFVTWLFTYLMMRHAHREIENKRWELTNGKR